jgi:hypothetical protein
MREYTIGNMKQLFNPPLHAPQVIREASVGVVLFMDTIAESPLLRDAWAQWFSWQASRWLKQAHIIRPHQASRLLFLDRHCIAKVCLSATCRS